MHTDHSLIILTPMGEENVILQEILHDMGYGNQDMAELTKAGKLFLQETGMGALNMAHTLYTSPHFFEKKHIDVILTGFAGALTPELGIGDSCQISYLTHFSFMEHQGAGDFEIISTPAPYYADFLAPGGDTKAPKLPHVRLYPSAVSGQDIPQRTLISVPALLQGKSSKEYLCTCGIDVVDMEGFSLASTLHHIQKSQKRTIPFGLDIIKVITDSPEEKFQFHKISEYKDHLRQCPLIRQVLKQKMDLL